MHELVVIEVGSWPGCKYEGGSRYDRQQVCRQARRKQAVVKQAICKWHEGRWLVEVGRFVGVCVSTASLWFGLQISQGACFIAFENASDDFSF